MLSDHFYKSVNEPEGQTRQSAMQRLEINRDNDEDENNSFLSPKSSLKSEREETFDLHNVERESLEGKDQLPDPSSIGESPYNPPIDQPPELFERMPALDLEEEKVDDNDPEKISASSKGDLQEENSFRTANAQDLEEPQEIEIKLQEPQELEIKQEEEVQKENTPLEEEELPRRKYSYVAEKMGPSFDEIGKLQWGNNLHGPEGFPKMTETLYFDNITSHQVEFGDDFNSQPQENLAENTGRDSECVQSQHQQEEQQGQEQAPPKFFDENFNQEISEIKKLKRSNVTEDDFVDVGSDEDENENNNENECLTQKINKSMTASKEQKYSESITDSKLAFKYAELEETPTPIHDKAENYQQTPQIKSAQGGVERYNPAFERLRLEEYDKLHGNLF